MERDLDERFVCDHAQFVRRLVRSIVGRDGDAAGTDTADDLVQETWLALRQRPPPSHFHLPAWLARVARRLAGRSRRSTARRSAREQAAARPEAVAATVDVASRAETLRAVTETVLSLDEPYRATVLQHYYEGLTAEAIAEREKAPLATVRSRLQRARTQLRERLARRLGCDFSALLSWIADGRPVAPIAPVGSPVPLVPVSTAQTAAGAVLMTAAAKLGIVSGVALLTGAAWWLQRDAVAHRDVSSEPAIAPLSSATSAASSATAEVAEVVAVEPMRAALAPLLSPVVLADERATLRVRVVWERDGAPAVDRGVRVIAWQAPAAQRWSRWRTDAAGELLLEQLVPGRFSLSVDLGGGTMVDVPAGVTSEVTLRIPASTGVHGRVVDAEQQPVAGASIWCSESGTPRSGWIVGRSDSEGRFELPCVPPGSYVAATHRGHTPSSLTLVEELRHRLEVARRRDGSSGPDLVEVTLTLGGIGAALHGVAFGPDGEPVAGVAIRAASNFNPALESPSFETLSGDDGSFAFEGLPLGDVELSAFRSGCAAWGTTVELAAGDDPEVELRFVAEGVVAGRVVDALGQPLAGANVHLAIDYDPLRPNTKSAADGTFRLGGLPTHHVELAASHPEAGEGRASITIVPGVIGTCELRLDRGLVLAGRIVDGEGAPAVAHRVQVHDATNRWWRSATTDAEGRFRVLCCIAEPLMLYVTPNEEERERLLAVAGVRAGGEEQRFVLGGMASIHAVIVDSDGRPALANLLTMLEGQQVGVAPPSDPLTGVIDFRGLAPGNYRLALHVEGRPDRPLGKHRLEAGQRLDLGTLLLDAPIDHD